VATWATTMPATPLKLGVRGYVRAHADHTSEKPGNKECELICIGMAGSRPAVAQRRLVERAPRLGSGVTSVPSARGQHSTVSARRDRFHLPCRRSAQSSCQAGQGAPAAPGAEGSRDSFRRSARLAPSADAPRTNEAAGAPSWPKSKTPDAPPGPPDLGMPRQAHSPGVRFAGEPEVYVAVVAPPCRHNREGRDGAARQRLTLAQVGGTNNTIPVIVSRPDVVGKSSRT
jgi:hypothetical protein